MLSVIDFSRKSYRKMRQNLAWAAGYNLLAVPLAGGVLAPVGFVLPMAVGALLTSASTDVVVLDAQLLRRLDLRPEASADLLLNEQPHGLWGRERSRRMHSREAPAIHAAVVSAERPSRLLTISSSTPAASINEACWCRSPSAGLGR